MPDNLRHVRPCHTITISPHTPIQPTPRMGPVSKLDNLRHARPEHHITISPHTPVQSTPCMGPVRTPDNLRHVGPNFHKVVLAVLAPDNPPGKVRYSGRLMVNQGSNYPNPGQTGPRGPRPPNSDPKVPMGSARNGGRRRKIGAGEVRAKTGQKSPFSAAGAAADVEGGPSRDAEAEPVLLAPVPSSAAAGG
ncbi:hypothetical protein L3X38_001722 [Prunus dulcis]|uniref:Uncharacterized protein n=1 Tax=Prunus dulcis TaxID=3755 RepID=A0AAD4ZK41_PRUDU|nr:hypothetical protein L3X38_001722 [Prunus dulcis]